MSDATGFATVGTTGVITVAAPASGSSCNTAFPPQFYFSLTGSLDQCESYAFYDYPNAILPVYFLGIIPSGESFVLQSDVTTAEYSWTVEAQAGTAMMFSMFDIQNNTGGCSTIQTVGPSPSNDASCLSSSSTSSTASTPAQSGSPSSSTTQIGSSPSVSLPGSSPFAGATGSSSSKKLSTATIAGIIGACVAVVVALVFLGLSQKRHKKRPMDFLPTSHSVPLLDLSGPLHEPDAFAIALAYPFTYQLDHIQPFMPPGQATSSMAHFRPQGSYSMSHSSTSLLGNPSTDANTHDFAPCDNLGVSPLSPSATGWGSVTAATSSISTPDIVHANVDATPPTALQVISPPPQYSNLPGPGGQ
ncbi:hypothetical protein EV401DRAFT_1928772 [Pisolithus croceorrhizus]|nr:hypothetical protein EV401DRAFT_1928772 [Pisolithus croceorrhizus]